MKIAVAAPTRIPARTANSLQVMKMAQALVRLGHEVRLAAPDSTGAQQASWEELRTHYGLCDPFEVDWLPASPRLRRYDYGLRTALWASRQGADLLYTRLPQAAAFASLASFPTILEIHDLPYGRMGSLFFRLFLSGRGARRLVVITRALAEDLARRFRLPAQGKGTFGPGLIVAPDGVDLERYRDLPEPTDARRALDLPGLSPGRFTAGYTGHLYPGRGLGLLFELARRLPEVNFLVAGGEPHAAEQIRAEARAAGLENLLLTGFVPNSDLPRYQAACDLLLMPYERRVQASSGGDISRYLSPMKVFEYLACGRAILSSDLPVLREVLSPENAVLLPPQDAEAWASAVTMLRSDATRRLELASQARRDSFQYSWEARAKNILQGFR